MGDFVIPGASLPIITAIVAGFVTAIVFMFRQVMIGKDRTLQDVMMQRDSYQRGWYQTVMALESAANRERAGRGEPPISILAPVIPAHNSATTVQQVHEARLQTLLARSTSAALALKIPLKAVEMDEVHRYFGAAERRD